MDGRQEGRTSFFAKKEAKKLSIPVGRADFVAHAHRNQKFLGYSFSKK
jgi:hypothetical protein